MISILPLSGIVIGIFVLFLIFLLSKQEEEIRILTTRLKKYDELIFAVGRKFPGETRHETALRYIYDAESNCGVETSETNPVEVENYDVPG